MRKLFAVLALAPALVLGACAFNPDGSLTVTTPPLAPITSDPTVQAIVVQVQADAKKVCSFIPAVETVKNVVATFTGLPPGVDLAFTVANAICGAVTKPGAKFGAAGPPVYVAPNGVIVPIHGSFVAGHRHGVRHRR